MDSPTYLPHLKRSQEFFTGFSHVYCAGVLNITLLSQVYVLGAASVSGRGKWNPSIFQEWGRGQVSKSPGPAHVSASSHVILMTFPTLLLSHFYRSQWGEKKRAKEEAYSCLLKVRLRIKTHSLRLIAYWSKLSHPGILFVCLFLSPGFI